MGVYRGRRSRGTRPVFFLAALVVSAAGLVGASGAGAGPGFSTTTPFTYEGVNTCNGESFTGTGNMTFSVSENLSGSGVLQSHTNVRIDALKAVTLTGKRYVVQDTLNHEFVFGSADEDTYDATVHYVRQGDDGTLILGDDFYEYVKAHITADSIGNVTSSYVRTNDMPCQ
jgi:hypothetical protein